MKKTILLIFLGLFLVFLGCDGEGDDIDINMPQDKQQTEEKEIKPVSKMTTDEIAGFYGFRQIGCVQDPNAKDQNGFQSYENCALLEDMFIKMLYAVKYDCNPYLCYELYQEGAKQINNLPLAWRDNYGEYYEEIYEAFMSELRKLGYDPNFECGNECEI